MSLDQARAIVHADATDPDDSTTLAAADLITLTATITDNDGDEASATHDIGQSLNFEDDAPTITVPFDGDQNAGNGNGTHETLANVLNASATGAFGYNIGADAHTAAFYTGGGSDFVDQNAALAGVQIGLSGTITGGGGGNVITSEVTLASENSHLRDVQLHLHLRQGPGGWRPDGHGGRHPRLRQGCRHLYHQPDRPARRLQLRCDPHQ